MEIVDDVIIPADLTPGEWVLGFRCTRRFSFCEHTALARCAPQPRPAARLRSWRRPSPTHAAPRFAARRWDAEESHQVWQSCSDVTILAKDS